MIGYLFGLAFCFVGCATAVAVTVIIGRIATTRPRLEHEREMVRLGEEKKRNALEADVTYRRMLEGGS